MMSPMASDENCEKFQITGPEMQLNLSLIVCKRGVQHGSTLFSNLGLTGDHCTLTVKVGPKLSDYFGGLICSVMVRKVNQNVCFNDLSQTPLSYNTLYLSAVKHPLCV